MVELDIPQTIKIIILVLLASEFLFMMLVWTGNDSGRSTTIVIMSIITIGFGILYILSTLIKIPFVKKNNIVTYVLFFFACLGRIITTIVVNKFSQKQVQDCFMEEDVAGCFKRMNILPLLAYGVVFWHFYKKGIKERGKKLSDL